MRTASKVPRWKGSFSSTGKSANDLSIITIGIDLAKNIFTVHGVNESGKTEQVKPKVGRDQLLPLIANVPLCLIGMEACTGPHHWARLFRQQGHTVRLIDPKFVTPYRMSGKRGKNDAAVSAHPLRLSAVAIRQELFHQPGRGHQRPRRTDQGRTPANHPHPAPHPPGIHRRTHRALHAYSTPFRAAIPRVIEHRFHGESIIKL